MEWSPWWRPNPPPRTRAGTVRPILIPGGGDTLVGSSPARWPPDSSLPSSSLVQLWIEYDPHPPFGGIDWTQVDRDMAEPVVAQWVQTQLADRPDLLATLSG
jgi:hypothetical protein